MGCVQCSGSISVCQPGPQIPDCPNETEIQDLNNGRSVSGWCWLGKITVSGQDVSVFSEVGDCEDTCTCRTMYMPFNANHEALQCY
jgi:hypothetical protein